MQLCHESRDLINHLLHGYVGIRKFPVLEAEVAVLLVFASARVCPEILGLYHRHPAALTERPLWLLWFHCLGI